MHIGGRSRIGGHLVPRVMDARSHRYTEEDSYPVAEICYK